MLLRVMAWECGPEGITIVTWFPVVGPVVMHAKIIVNNLQFILDNLQILSFLVI